MIISFYFISLHSIFYYYVRPKALDLISIYLIYKYLFLTYVLLYLFLYSYYPCLVFVIVNFFFFFFFSPFSMPYTNTDTTDTSYLN